MSAPYMPQVKFAGREQCPMGGARAVIIEMYHVGNVEDTYEGKTTVKEVIHVVVEVHKRKSDGTRFTIGRDIGTYLGSPAPKTGTKTVLRRMAESCFGRINEKEFTPWNLLGKSCQVQIGETSGGNAKIEGWSSLSDEQEPLAPIKPLKAWSVADPNCKIDDDGIPDFILTRAKSSREYQARDLDAQLTRQLDAKVANKDDDGHVDGIPF